MDLLGDVLKVPRQRAPSPRETVVPGLVVASGAATATPYGSPTRWTPSRRRLVVSWLVVVASLWSIHVAGNSWNDMRAWDAAMACPASDAGCLARHDVTTQAVTARIEVDEHVARVVLLPSARTDPDREARTVFLEMAPSGADGFVRSEFDDMDLTSPMRVLRHDDTPLGLVDADGTRWSGLHASLPSVTLQAQWGLLGLFVGWSLVARRDLRPLKVAAVSGAVVGVVALLGASTSTMWAVLGVLVLASVVLSRRPGLPGRSPA